MIKKEQRQLKSVYATTERAKPKLMDKDAANGAPDPLEAHVDALIADESFKRGL